ncbi:hypothetical protein AJ79_07831 [Helicocarpus griseus UAMH5409]|uniref:Cell pattern formation-associated protein stuA n=1 Tax=Helicocarpus griseus UAMH5409 TaxID=1447875 RepID=A0A2B7WYZ0_9EURO|nr:hypothetical protein AJ79_07831 [Helicocarpus griseus UAMH5409]
MRSLPKRINPLILPESSPKYEDLLSRRRLGKTNLSVKPGQIGTSSATRPENLGMFEYAHLRAPLPKDLKGSEIFSFQPPQTNPEAYFLMRRSKDGYVSATGMFKIAFPWAKHSEERNERDYLKTRSETSEDEIAGNVWIAPDLALEIAKDYGMFDWVRALLDPTEIVQNVSSPEKQISPPPKFEMPPIESSALAAPTLPATRKSRRSVSPTKVASPKKNASSRKPRQTRAQKEASAASLTAANASLQSTLDAAASKASTDEKVQANGEESVDEEAAEIPVKKSKDHVKAVEVTEETEETVETKRVDLAPPLLPNPPLAEDTERMISEAKEMVDEAKQELEEAQSSSKNKDAAKKRKAEEVAEEEEQSGDAAATPAQPAKRARLLEDKLRRERVRNRALVGVTATLALA